MFLVLGDIYCVLHTLAVVQADAGSYLPFCFCRQLPCFRLAPRDLLGAVEFSEPSTFAPLGSSEGECRWVPAGPRVPSEGGRVTLSLATGRKA